MTKEGVVPSPAEGKARDLLLDVGDFVEDKIDIGSPAPDTAEETEQAEVVCDTEEVADSVESPFRYLIVYVYEVLQARLVSVQELEVIQPELLEFVVLVK